MIYPSFCTVPPASSTCYLFKKNRAKLSGITNKAARIIGLPTPKPTELKNRPITHIAILIEQDTAHPLNIHLTPLPSRWRCRALRCRQVHFGRSLFPAAIAVVNKRPHWSGQSVTAYTQILHQSDNEGPPISSLCFHLWLTHWTNKARILPRNSMSTHGKPAFRIISDL